MNNVFVHRYVENPQETLDNIEPVPLIVPGKVLAGPVASLTLIKDFKET